MMYYPDSTSNYRLSFLLIPILVCSCIGSGDRIPDEIQGGLPGPVVVDLNVEAGYTINAVTGDTIQPLVNSYGDTISTGIPIKLTGTTTYRNSELEPLAQTLIHPTPVRVDGNIHEIPGEIKAIPVNMERLESFIIGKDSSGYTARNSMGDTIPTGMEIPVEGSIVQSRFAVPVESKEPSVRDDDIFSIRYLDVDHGLISSHFHAVCQDRMGRLWFGASGGGAICYDGHRFVHITPEHGILDYTVLSVLEDKKGNIWLGTNEGLSIYDG